MHAPDKKKLKFDGLEQIAGPVWIRGSRDDLAARLRAVDLVASDVDECMLPFIGQAKAGLYVLRRVAGSANTPRELRLATRMGSRAGALLAQKMYHKITGWGQNSRLIMQFEDFVKGAPLKYFASSARKLVHQGLPGVPETVRIFNERHVPFGMISLGVDLVIEPYRRHLERRHGAHIEFTDCTRTLENNGTFAGYNPDSTLSMPEHKATRVRERVGEFSASHPLIIGHDRDDMGMFRAARELGGLAMGFNPVPDSYPLLDIAIFADNWHAVADFLQTLLKEARTGVH
jgi:hypothetical protein